MPFPTPLAESLMIAKSPLRCLMIGASLVGLALVGSCSEDVPAGPEVTSVELAKGGSGKGGGGSTGDPIVRDTDPPGTEQGTVDLQVRILGSGFEHPAHVRFLMDGDPIGIATSDTAEFVSDSELVTTITVAADAPLGLWDVEVELLTKRRKGIGIELFAVVADFFTEWTGTLETSGAEAVTRNQDNRTTLDVSAASFTVEMNFDNTVAHYGTNVNFAQADVPDGQPSGNCWLVVEGDFSGFDPSVTPAGIAAVLMNTLTFDGSRPRELKNLVIDKRNLGRQYPNHAVRIIRGDDEGSVLDAEGRLVDLSTNPVNPLQWGQNNPPSGKLLRVDLVSGDVNDPGSVRVFDLSEGMVRVVGRLGPSPGPLVHLLCDVHPDDTARVTIRPNPLSTPGKKR
jgi:hypothetical protein